MPLNSTGHLCYVSAISTLSEDKNDNKLHDVAPTGKKEMLYNSKYILGWTEIVDMNDPKECDKVKHR